MGFSMKKSISLAIMLGVSLVTAQSAMADHPCEADMEVAKIIKQMREYGFSKQKAKAVVASERKMNPSIRQISGETIQNYIDGAYSQPIHSSEQEKMDNINAFGAMVLLLCVERYSK